MLAEFFLKRARRHLAVIIAVIIVVFCVGYACFLNRAKQVAFELHAYFLVKEGVAVEAGAEFTRWEGGAGYLIERNGIKYAVINVFFGEDLAKSVQNRLKEKGQSTKILPQGVDTLYFKGKAKKDCEVYISQLKLLKSYLLLLNDCIARLEKGMTQEACKRVLKTLALQMEYSHEVNTEYSEFCLIYQESLEMIENIYCGNVYLKDLRYLLSFQTDNLLKLCSAFTL